MSAYFRDWLLLVATAVAVGIWGLFLVYFWTMS